MVSVIIGVSYVMKLLELEKHKKVWVDFNKASDLELSEFKSVISSISIDKNILFGARAFALELLLPRNSSFYAALGAQYLPSNAAGNTIIEVRYAKKRMMNYMSAHAYNKKTVFIGLPQEYSESIISIAREYLAVKEVPAGRIVFDSAAHCEVGSSPLIFMIATKIILDILCNSVYPLSDSEIKSICEKHTSGKNWVQALTKSNH